MNFIFVLCCGNTGPALPIFTRKIAEDVKLTPQKLKAEKAKDAEEEMDARKKARIEKLNKKANKKALKRKNADDAETGVDLELQPDDLVEQKPAKRAGLKKMEVVKPKKTSEEKASAAKVSKKKGKVKKADEPLKKKKKKVAA